MTAYETATDLLSKNVHPVVLATFNDGETRKMRLFKSDNGDVCYFGRRRRRYGYLLPSSVVKIVPCSARAKKSPEKKWSDGWQRVIAKLKASGLWAHLIPDIELALKIGYHRMQEANSFYWDLPHDDNQVAAFKAKYPELIRTNDEGKEYIDTSTLWNYSKLPRVKKMRFERGSYNNTILAGIQQAMDKKEKHKAWGRYQYDISFEYHPDKQVAFYSEEYRGCGNGHYYIALNATHALFMEDD